MMPPNRVQTFFYEVVGGGAKMCYQCFQTNPRLIKNDSNDKNTKFCTFQSVDQIYDIPAMSWQVGYTKGDVYPHIAQLDDVKALRMPFPAGVYIRNSVLLSKLELLHVRMPSRLCKSVHSIEYMCD